MTPTKITGENTDIIRWFRKIIKRIKMGIKYTKSAPIIIQLLWFYSLILEENIGRRRIEKFCLLCNQIDRGER